MSDLEGNRSNRQPSYAADGPIYHEVSPKIVWATRGCGGVAAFMVFLAIIFCLAEGHKNNAYYLLACNLIISGFVGMVNAWWYRSGELGADKFWYMMVVCGVIVFQCLTTDIFVFHSVPTTAPTTAPPPGNLTTFQSMGTMRTPTTT